MLDCCDWFVEYIEKEVFGVEEVVFRIFKLWLLGFVSFSYIRIYGKIEV